MLEKGNEIIVNAGNILVDKLKGLNDPSEIGKCIRTGIVSSAIVGVSYIICKNGGINFKNLLLIGVNKTND